MTIIEKIQQIITRKRLNRDMSVGRVRSRFVVVDLGKHVVVSIWKRGKRWTGQHATYSVDCGTEQGALELIETAITKWVNARSQKPTKEEDTE
jgi:hypothetical protein